MESKDVVFVDAVQSLGVHNGVARLALMRLGADGKPVTTIELLVPIPQVRSMAEALMRVAK